MQRVIDETIDILFGVLLSVFCWLMIGFALVVVPFAIFVGHTIGAIDRLYNRVDRLIRPSGRDEI